MPELSEGFCALGELCQGQTETEGVGEPRWEPGGARPGLARPFAPLAPSHASVTFAGVFPWIPVSFWGWVGCSG